jgi:Rhodopirellula transposase DDE domain
VVSLYTQSERCHQNTTGYVKITAKQVKADLISQKLYKVLDFSLGTVNNVLNRLGYSLKKVRKTLPLKRIEQTDAIFDNVFLNRKNTAIGTLRLSFDVKDKVRVGELSRKGYHRGKEDVCALDKDQHWNETLVPMGILEIESGKSTIIVGNSNETSDFIVDGFEKWYEMEKENLNLKGIHTLELYGDNGPAIHSHRTQFIKRMMEFACITNLNIHLIYYPPYHSKYNPIERVWAAVEQYWNGTILSSVDKVIKTLQNVKWKNINLNSVFIDKVYQKGISLSDKEMAKLEAFLIRKPDLQKWDVWIKPSFEMGILFFE